MFSQKSNGFELNIQTTLDRYLRKLWTKNIVA